MNKEILDVLVVGSGCCGIFASLKLMKHKKIAIIEAGKPLNKKICPFELCGNCVECNPVCNILGGFGGSQFFEGTKLSRYPAGTNLINFCKDKALS